MPLNQGASIETIKKAGDGINTPTIYGEHIRCLPREVLVTIPE